MTASILATSTAAPITLVRSGLVVSLFFEVIALTALVRLARQHPRRSPDRRFWSGIALTLMLFIPGCVAQLALTWDSDEIGMTDVTGGLFGIGTLIAIGAVIRYPLPAGSGAERLRFSLDLATVLVCAAGFGWYSLPGVTVADLLAGPVVMLLAAFAAGKLIIFGRAPYASRVGWAFACATTLTAIAQATQGTFAGYGIAGLSIALNPISDALIAIGAQWQLAGGATTSTRVRRAYSPLPYLAIAAGYLMLMVALTTEGLTGRSWVLLGAVATSTGIVVVRQLVTFTDNARLVADLRSALGERDELAGQLHRMAFEDQLTGLANRAMLDQRMAALAPELGRPGVILIDLDGFKQVNDTYGHAAGDQVLAETATRLSAHFRATDTVARMGGDEFVVLTHGLAAPDMCHLADRIIGAVGEPIRIGAITVTIGASVGLAVDTDGGTPNPELLRRADLAMYSAKHSGKNCHVLYDGPLMTADVPVPTRFAAGVPA